MSPVRYEVDNGVAWLTIDRPEARNALSAAVRDGLWDGVRRFNDDDSAAVLVLTGAGDTAFWIWEPVYHSADAQEGPAAFRDKRTPVWKGR